MTDTDIHRALGRLDATVAAHSTALAAHQEVEMRVADAINSRLDRLERQVEALNLRAASAGGGLRVLIAVGSVAASLGGVAAWLAPKIARMFPL